MPNLQFNTKIATKMVETAGDTPPAASNDQSKRTIQYQLKQVIGKGSYGIVYKAVNRKTSEVVAIKEINYSNSDELDEIMVEIDLLKGIEHVNIIKYFGFMKKMSSLYIILEYAAHGSLKNILATRENHCLTELETRGYIRQTVEGLAYLHDQNIIHRDIKAANLLLDIHNVVKLADFGVSTKANKTAMTLAGSLNWMAPEIITNKGAITLSDIWSVGATIVELMTGKPPYYNLLDINIFYAMENENEKYYPPESIPETTKQFLKFCLQKNMFKRLSAKELLRQPWLQNIEGYDSMDELSKFKESFDEDAFNWDEDFIDNDNKSLGLNLIRNSSPQKLNNINNSPLKRTPFKKLNNNIRELSRTPSRKSFKTAMRYDEYYDDEYLDIDDSLIYDGYYYLNELESEEFKVPLDKISLIFDDCDVEDIIGNVINLLSQGNPTDSHITFVKELFRHDIENTNSIFIQKFIDYGGLSMIIAIEPLVYEIYCSFSSKHEFFKLAFHNGVMNCQNISQYASNKVFYFELVYKYFEFTSIKYWYNWCSKNLDLELLINCLHEIDNKRIQSIVLKLSAFDTNADEGANHWVLKRMLPMFVRQKPSTNSQITYIVFKSITYLLQNPASYFTMTTNKTNNISNTTDNTNQNKITDYEANKNARKGIVSRSGSVSMTPVSGSPMKQRISSNPHFKNFKLDYDVDASTDENDLSIFNELPTWLKMHLNDPQVIKNDINFNNSTISNNNNNIHVWKYFLKVCLISCRINKEYLFTICLNENFVKLIKCNLIQYEKKMDKHYSNQDFKNLRSNIQTILYILVDISKITRTNLKTKKLLTDTVVEILKTKNYEFTVSCMEYLLNMFINDTNHELTFPHHVITNTFYQVNPEDINFNAMINVLMKICSLTNSIELCGSIVCHTDFIHRIKILFQFFANSLLIQIELLKFLRILFMRWNHNKSIKQQIDQFLNVNWEMQSKDQVGSDSLLIKQLCLDINQL